MSVHDHEGRIRVIHSCTQQPCPLVEALQAWNYRVILGAQAQDNPNVLAVLLVVDDARVSGKATTQDCAEATARLFVDAMDLGKPPRMA